MKKWPWIVATMCGALSSCTNIECPLDNVVVMTAHLYETETGNPLTITDSLTVFTSPKDSILLNRAQGIKKFAVPVRHGASCDTLLLRFSNIDQAASDTLFISKTDLPHFESIDCPATMFHYIKSVSWTSHRLADFPLTIDSVAVIRSKVDYDDVENIRIYLRSTAQ